MRKILYVFFLVSFLVTSPLMAEDVEVKNASNKIPFSPVITIMTNYSSTGNGTGGIGTIYNLNQLAVCHTWSLDIKGTPSTVSLSLQGSIDNSGWFDLDSYTGTTDTMRHIANKPVLSIRGKLTTFDNGTSVTARIVSGGC